MTGEHITFEIANELSDQKISSMPHIDETDFGFTRYLYIIDDVASSIVLAILEQNREEALFWAYELYFSGWKTRVILILQQMVDVMYRVMNPRLLPFLESKIAEWTKTNSYCIVGTFIYNMVGRPYDVREFIRTYCEDNEWLESLSTRNSCERSSPLTGRQIYINVEPKDVKKYITVNHIKPHYLLRTVAKYPVRTNARRIFESDHHAYTHHQIQSLYWYTWLYYASVSPIWGERIAKYEGVLNNDKHIVEFSTYEQDEAFHDKYNLEPDEQPIEIQNWNIGDAESSENQMTWIEFYKKYAINS